MIALISDRLLSVCCLSLLVARCSLLSVGRHLSSWSGVFFVPFSSRGSLCSCSVAERYPDVKFKVVEFLWFDDAFLNTPNIFLWGTWRD